MLGRLERQARGVLDEQAKKIVEAGGEVAKAHFRIGRPDEEIVSAGDEIGAGLVVTGRCGLSGVRRALMRSVSDSVVRYARCPVLVVANRSS